MDIGLHTVITASKGVDAMGSQILSDVLFYPAQDIRCTHRARLASDFSAAHEQGKRWNALNSIVRCNFGLVLRIKLGKPHLGLELLRGLLEGGRHALARSAPGGPEIDQQRNIIAAHMLLKTIAIEFERMTDEDRFSALAAAGVISKTARRNAINCGTVRADNTG